jgi:hypothetical protein
MRGSVNHAESLSALLSRLEAQPGHVAARAWLHGRSEEVECFVRQLTKDLGSRRLSERAAASALDAYLEALHQGLALHFDETCPPCCEIGRRESHGSEEIHADELLAGLPTLVGR